MILPITCDGPGPIPSTVADPAAIWVRPASLTIEATTPSAAAARERASRASSPPSAFNVTWNQEFALNQKTKYAYRLLKSELQVQRESQFGLESRSINREEQNSKQVAN